MDTRDDVASKLDLLVRLTALHVLGDKTGADAIRFLARAGLSNDVIADIVRTTPATVRAALSRARKKATT
jgi:hypothetical protein